MWVCKQLGHNQITCAFAVQSNTTFGPIEQVTFQVEMQQQQITVQVEMQK